MTEPIEVTETTLEEWANDVRGPVALHLKQRLLPPGDGTSIVFPPTYADIGYNIDTLSDGTTVATIDSVGSQANRLEPIFKAPKDAPRADWLVPQLEIKLNEGETRSLLDLAHRSGDAVVRASGLASEIEVAFQALRRKGDAGPLCTLAPTSLLFGVWDSRGTFEKRPRLLRAEIRAWDVEPLRRPTQYTSEWKALDENQQKLLREEARRQKARLSEQGFADAPAVSLGGIVVRGHIEREVTVNLIALRGLQGKDDGETQRIHRYLLGLTLLAATEEIDLFLREGCLLRYDKDDRWYAVPRRGEREEVGLASARPLIERYARNASDHFRSKWPNQVVHEFDLKRAGELLKKNANAVSEEK